MKKRYYWQGIPAILQLEDLKKSTLCPGSGRYIPGKLALEYQFHVKPMKHALTYQVKIDYREQHSPIIHVLNPCLQKLAEERFGNTETIPHLYQQSSGKLCLYYPYDREWQPHQFLSKTIVPWVYLYLYYFEYWLMNGEWHGGSAPGCAHEFLPPIDLEG